MFDEKISQFSDLPLQGTPSIHIDKDRKRTDIICTIIGAIFAITMFVLAWVFLNTSRQLFIQITMSRATTLLTPTGLPVDMESTQTIHLSTSHPSATSTL